MIPDEIHELEQRMDELAREYGATHDPKILAELKVLASRYASLRTPIQLFKGYFIDGIALSGHPF